MRGIRSGITAVFMRVYILKVMFCRLRQIHNPCYTYSRMRNQRFFVKFGCFSHSEMCEEIALESESDRTGILGSSLKNTTMQPFF